MSYNIVLTDNFKKEAKKLSKKYKSLKNDLRNLGEELAKNPGIGTPPGNEVYKLRMAITSKGKGKSGGARVITYVKVSSESVFLISIYDKSKVENPDKTQITKLLEKTGLI